MAAYLATIMDDPAILGGSVTLYQPSREEIAADAEDYDDARAMFDRFGR